MNFLALNALTLVTFLYSSVKTGASSLRQEAILKDEFLLVNDNAQNTIFQIDLNTGEAQVAIVPGDRARSHVAALAFDPDSEKVYWSDLEANKIIESTRSGENRKTVKHLNSSASVDGMAVDYINRLLYFTDTGNNLIGVVSLGTSNHFAYIITDELDEPRDVVLSPQDGLMYWSDWGKYHRIEYANMDGSERAVLYSPGDASQAWINGLALDSAESKLYWVDAYRDTINVFNLETQENTVLLTDSERAPHNFAIDVIGQYIYVSDWVTNYIQRMPKTGGTLTQFGPSFNRLYDIKGYNSSERFPAFSVCASSACEHLCLPRSTGRLPFSCRCSEGYVSFNGGISCEKTPTPTIEPTNTITVASKDYNDDEDGGAILSSERVPPHLASCRATVVMIAAVLALL